VVFRLPSNPGMRPSIGGFAKSRMLQLATWVMPAMLLRIVRVIRN
jgi:hypothetical protein